MLAALTLAAPVASLPRLAAAAPPGLEAICGKECTPQKVAKCSGFLEGLAANRAGELWGVALMDGKIFKLENGACVEKAKIPRPNGAKFHKDGRLFVTDYMSGLGAFDPKTGEVRRLRDDYMFARLRGTNDLIFDKTGGVYFTEPYALKPDGRVFYIANETAAPTLLADNLAFPNGIALSPDGRLLYVAEYLANRIMAIPLAGPGQLGPFSHVFARLDGGTGPDGIAVDQAGNVYAAHNGAKQVAVIGPNGFVIGAIKLPPEAGAMPTNLALHDGWLYITESAKDEIWRVRAKIPPLPGYQSQ
jgi:gluconolactonase